MTDDEEIGLVIDVVFNEPRFHGEPEWPPSPARLFQALVAGVGVQLNGTDLRALQWIETMPAPSIGVPPTRRGQKVGLYVPNNDLDAKDGDPTRIAEIRVLKAVHPRIMEGSEVLYAWLVPAQHRTEAETICRIADHLYQLGRGVDGAWARGRTTSAEELAVQLLAYRGRVYRPTPKGTRPETVLLCPMMGSMSSLQQRFVANQQRLRWIGQGPQRRQAFSQPPKARFRTVGYASPPDRALFELRPASDVGRLAALPPATVAEVVLRIRNATVERLKAALSGRDAAIEEYVMGRWEGKPPSDPACRRARIVPLPSIGHEHVDQSIRRVLVELPAGGQLMPQDVLWALSGLPLPGEGVDSEPSVVLVRAEETQMLAHYGVDRGRSTLWRTVTPAVLPAAGARRRIEPSRMREQRKGSSEREEEQHRAIDCVQQALRHACVSIPVQAVRVQRESFDRRGMRAEAFAPGTRFEKERLWHVELRFASSVEGPLLIGDGRFLGLGLMHPVREERGIFAFQTVGFSPDALPVTVCRAARRAVMAIIQDTIGDRKLPSYFSGHTADGAAARDATGHLGFAFEARRQILFILAPHVGRREEPRGTERSHLRRLERALENLGQLRAGVAGVAALRPVQLDPERDDLLRPSRVWRSQTPYLVNRHQRRGGAHDAIARDLREECARRGLPASKVVVHAARSRPGAGLEGDVTLRFNVAIPGPLLLGRTRHLGGGLFGSLASEEPCALDAG